MNSEQFTASILPILSLSPFGFRIPVSSVSNICLFFFPKAHLQVKSQQTIHKPDLELGSFYEIFLHFQAAKSLVAKCHSESPCSSVGLLCVWRIGVSRGSQKTCQVATSMI